MNQLRCPNRHHPAVLLVAVAVAAVASADVTDSRNLLEIDCFESVLRDYCCNIPFGI